MRPIDKAIDLLHKYDSDFVTKIIETKIMMCIADNTAELEAYCREVLVFVSPSFLKHEPIKRT